MRLAAEVAARSLRRHLTYRAAAVAGLVTNLFFGVLRAEVLLALYGGRETVAGYGVADAVTYAGLTQALIAMLMIFGWYELMATVHSGEVAGDLLRPMDYQAYWLARDAGRAVAGLLLRGVLLLALYGLIFDLRAPAGPLGWLALAAALGLAWLVSFAFRFLVNLAAFWSPNAAGIGRFLFFAGLFFSGFFMPLDFFPAWVQAAAAWTPFPYMVDTVVEVYLGIAAGPALLGALALQAAWALALLLAGRAVLALGVRRLTLLGG